MLRAVSQCVYPSGVCSALARRDSGGLSRRTPSVTLVYRSLCSRCGAVIEAPMPEGVGAARGECSECGQGWAASTLIAAKPRRWFLRWRRSPRVRSERDVSEYEAQVISRWQLPLYGLDETWEGSRWIGGYAAGGRTTKVDLAHGNPWVEDGPLVRVEIAAMVNGPVDHVLTAEELVNRLYHETGTTLPQFKETFRSDEPTGSWDKVTFDLDGVPTGFDFLAIEAWWIALREEPGYLISIEARHVSPSSVRLVTIRDVDPYVGEDKKPRP